MRSLLVSKTPWDFNQHKINPLRIDFQGLKTYLESLSGWAVGDYPKDLEALDAFSRAGFDLYFLPNG